ncbi:hypothetical protein SAMN05216227_100236 [Pseudorhodobacter antarcticus]|jgi:hypothetical protein|uniref:SnoaL-like domain-containing protein n=1 Tax=Pseudorhodobacter antarcticus TaxID=1077947 RepID=A0A1H8B042_9RHOB|nr:hypothetical protein [Pseudorhodobacter antarcticus]SEM75177.1 hypothetical protein SAMN05216227_100236 [Pseudorhodobacter antarcticus]
MRDFATAKEVAEYSLEQTGIGLMSGDFDLFAPHFLLPQYVKTFDGKRLLQTREDVRSVFDAVRAHFNKLQVTLLSRTCISAEFQDADTVFSTHETRLIARDVMVQQPYPVFSVLRRVGGVWLVADSEYAIVEAPWHSKAFGPATPERGRA